MKLTDAFDALMYKLEYSRFFVPSEWDHTNPAWVAAGAILLIVLFAAIFTK